MKPAFVLSAMLALAPMSALAAEPNPAMQAFLHDTVLAWAHDPVIVEAVKAQNATTAGYDAARIDALDKTWRAEVGTAATPTIDPVLTNAAADFLRGRVAANGGMITEVFIMDAQGLNVAASSVTSDYWQGDEDKFQQTYPMGPGAEHYSDIEFDESIKIIQFG